MAHEESIQRPNNHILLSLTDSDFALIVPHLEPADLPVRKILEDPGKPIAHVYFPESGLVSIVANGVRLRAVEAGIIGREGMTGIAIIMGSDRSSQSAYMQVAGHGVQLNANSFRKAIKQSDTLHAAVLNFVHAFMVQTAQSALANGRGRVEERLARWLLMANDRFGGTELHLTHEFLAIMLAVRRAGVTEALLQLKSQSFIDTRRGIIEIRNRPALESFANGFYGAAEREYQRLIGWDPRQTF